MKIGIDFRPALMGHAGIGRYVRELGRALPGLLDPEEELKLFGVAYQPPPPGLEDPGAVPSQGKVELIRKRFPSRLLHGLGWLGLMHVESFTGSLDLFLYTDYVYPPLKGTPSILMLFDLLFMYETGINTPAFCRNMEKRVGRALARASGVMVPSRATRLDLERFFPQLDAPVCVIPLGGDHLGRVQASIDSAALPPMPYFLSVGTLEPRKNRIRLLEAFASVAAAFPEIHLVIAGRPGWMAAPFHEALDASPVRNRIHLRVDGEDGELRQFYENALALVYPSLGEGYGLPVAEAMALDCPVITSNRSSLPEAAGGAALLVDPLDVGSLAGAMKCVAEDEEARKRLVAAGRERVKSLTWERTAAKTLDFMRRIAGKDGGLPGE